MMKVLRNDVLLANLEPVVGSEQGKIRPVLVIQNDILNYNSPTTIVAPITSKLYSEEYPNNVSVSAGEGGLRVNSTILLNQIKTISKKRIIKKIGALDNELMRKVDFAIKVSLGLD